MKIPKIISKNNHEYIFVKQCNDDLFLYEHMLYHYKTTFNRHDLGLVKEVKTAGKKIRHYPKI